MLIVMLAFKTKTIWMWHNDCYAKIYYELLFFKIMNFFKWQIHVYLVKMHMIWFEIVTITIFPFFIFFRCMKLKVQWPAGLHLRCQSTPQSSWRSADSGEDLVLQVRSGSCTNTQRGRDGEFLRVSQTAAVTTAADVQFHTHTYRTCPSCLSAIHSNTYSIQYLQYRTCTDAHSYNRTTARSYMKTSALMEFTVVFHWSMNVSDVSPAVGFYLH